MLGILGLVLASGTAGASTSIPADPPGWAVGLRDPGDAPAALLYSEIVAAPSSPDAGAAAPAMQWPRVALPGREVIAADPEDPWLTLRALGVEELEILVHAVTLRDWPAWRDFFSGSGRARWSSRLQTSPATSTSTSRR